MTPQRYRLAVLLWSLTLAATPSLHAQDAESASPAEAKAAQVKWTDGPGTGDLGEAAAIRLPAGYHFTGTQGTRELLEAGGNPTSGRELGLVRPAAGDWFVVFKFNDTGYVKDDDKDKLDADAILTSIRKGTEHSNEERKKRGWDTIEIVGWEQAPRYDTATHNLEWAIRGKDKNGFVINYNTRILGRKGVMEAALVVSPEGLAGALIPFKELLGGYSYKSGEGYAEFRKGDKIAQYGLTALVAGGAAAVALKTGLLQKFGKLIAVGVLAALAGLRKLASRLFGRGDDGVLKR